MRKWEAIKKQGRRRLSAKGVLAWILQNPIFWSLAWSFLVAYCAMPLTVNYPFVACFFSATIGLIGGIVGWMIIPAIKDMTGRAGFSRMGKALPQESEDG